MDDDDIFLAFFKRFSHECVEFDKKENDEDQYTHHINFDFLNLETENDCPN